MVPGSIFKLGATMKQILLGCAFLIATTGALVAADATGTKPAAAPMASQNFTCKGDVWVVRKSQIIPGGSLEGFMKAVADQIAWYRANGVTTNEQRVGRVFTYNSDTHERKLVEDEVVTIHMSQPQTEKLPRGDAKWDAFVAEFRANSKMIDETELCMAPKA